MSTPKYVYGHAVVTAAVAVNLREFSRRLDKGDCAGMFITGLSASGSLPATHFISSGAIPEAYADTITDPILLFTRAKKAWEDDGDVFPFTQPQVTNAWNNCTFTNATVMKDIGGEMTRVPESGLELIERLGLKIAA